MRCTVLETPRVTAALMWKDISRGGQGITKTLAMLRSLGIIKDEGDKHSAGYKTLHGQIRESKRTHATGETAAGHGFGLAAQATPATPKTSRRSLYVQALVASESATDLMGSAQMPSNREKRRDFALPRLGSSGAAARKHR